MKRDVCLCNERAARSFWPCLTAKATAQTTKRNFFFSQLSRAEKCGQRCRPFVCHEGDGDDCDIQLFVMAEDGGKQAVDCYRIVN